MTYTEHPHHGIIHGDPTITRCDRCGQDTAVIVPVLRIDASGVHTMFTIRHCRPCDGADALAKERGLADYDDRRPA